MSSNPTSQFRTILGTLSAPVSVKRPRGRPVMSRDSPEGRQQIAIAKTINQLLFWGFVLKMASYAVWKNINKRLSTDRIDQIFKEWRKGIKPCERRYSGRYGIDDLRRHRPGSDIQELTRILLANNGEWPKVQGADRVVWGDLALTEKAHTDFMKNRLRLVR